MGDQVRADKLVSVVVWRASREKVVLGLVFGSAAMLLSTGICDKLDKQWSIWQFVTRILVFG